MTNNNKQDVVQGSLAIDMQLRADQQSPRAKAELSQKETRQIVTPYAFFVADELLGTPLAKPMRRGLAMSIDLICIALLTQVSSLVLAAVAAATFFKAGNRLKTKKRFNGVRMVLRLLVALLLFVVAKGIIEEINHNPVNVGNLTQSQNDIELKLNDEINGMEIFTITAKYLLKTKEITEQITQGECAPAKICVEQLGEEIVLDVIELGGQKDLLTEVIDGYTEGVSEFITKQENSALKAHLTSFAESQLLTSVKQAPAVTTKTDSVAQHSAKLSTKQAPVNVEDAEVNPPVQTNSKTQGLLSWIEATLEELGLGLGWAAFYFSVFTAWWKGQTPGKKVMGIKVIKLDNQPLNLWESFGRYGGYAAGFATGLTGFLQVLWDPNRQAIQDKISETLVIDLRKAKVPFVKSSVEMP